MVLFVIVGDFIDAVPAIIIFMPIINKLTELGNIRPLHMGVVIITTLVFGLITPPYGVLLFVLNAVTGIPLKVIIDAIWPWVAVLVVCLLVMILVPDVVLWLPKRFGYVG